MSYAVTAGDLKTRTTTRVFAQTSNIFVAPTDSQPAYTNSKVVFTPGQYVTFPGTGYLSTSDSPHLNFGSYTLGLGTTGVTVACTFMFAGTGTAERLIDFNNGGSNLVLGRSGTTSDLYFAYGSYGVTTGGFQFELGTVYTVVAVYDPSVGSTGQLRIHVGLGSRVSVTPNATATPAVKGSSSVTYANTFVGRSFTASNSAFTGRIYALRVFNRVLTTTEIITPVVTFVNAPYYAGLLGTTKLDIAYTPTSSNYTFSAWLYRINGSIFMSTGAVTLGTDGTQFTGFHNAISFTLGGAVTSNAWQHVIVSYSASTSNAVMFLNGTKTSTTTVPSYVPSGSIRTGEDWKGYIDDLRMYPTALGDQACADLYTYETALTSDTPVRANTYVCHDVGIQFGSNVMPTTSSPGGYTIDAYGPIVFRETPRASRTVVTPWFIQNTKRLVVTPYVVGLDYSFAAWIYYIDGTTLFNNPALTIGTNGTNFTGAHNGSTFLFGQAFTRPTWSNVGGPITVTTPGITAASGVTIAKGAGTNGYTTIVSSNTSYTSQLFCSGRAASSNVHVKFGISNVQASNALSYGWFCNAGTLQVIESNVVAATITGGYSPGTDLSITYDGVNVNYFTNGVLRRTTAANPDLPMYMKAVPYEASNTHLTHVLFDNGTGIRGDQWMHVVFTYASDFNTASLFVNGARVADNLPAGASPYTLSTPMTVCNSWRGSIDDIRVFNGRLTDTDATLLYRAELGYASDGALPPVLFASPDFKLDFGEPTIDTLTDVGFGRFPVTVTGALTIRQQPRNGKNMNTPFTLTGIKYLAVDYNLRTDYTVAFWLYGASTSGDIFSTSNVAISLSTNVYTLNNVTLGSETFIASAWQHVVISYLGDFSTANLYINGTIAAYDVVIPAPYVPDTVTPLTICQGWTGTIDNIRVFTGIMSPSQVAALYAFELNLTVDPPLPTPVFTSPDLAINFGIGTVPLLSDVYPQDTYIFLSPTRRSIPNIAPLDNAPQFYDDVIEFDAEAVQYINSGPATWNIQTAGFTVVIDFVLTNLAQYFEGLFCAQAVSGGRSIDGNNTNNIMVMRNGNSQVFIFRIYDAAGDYVQVYSPSLSQDTRYAMACVFDPTSGGTMSMYIDGTLVATRTGIIPQTVNGINYAVYSGYFNRDPLYFLTATKIAEGVTESLVTLSKATDDFRIENSSQNNFSVQWLGYFYARDAGSYDFTLSSNVQAYVWIGQDAINNYITSTAVVSSNNFIEATGSVTLSIGTYYRIRVQYGVDAHPGLFDIEAYVTPPGGSKTDLADACLSEISGNTTNQLFFDRDVENNCIGCLYPGGYYAANSNIYTLATYNRTLTSDELFKIFNPSVYTVTDVAGLQVNSVNFEYTNGVIYIPFENSVTDVISGTVTTQANNAVTYTTGIVGQCALFSNNSAASTPNQYYTMTEPFDGIPLSIAFRFKPLLTAFSGTILCVTDGLGNTFMSLDYTSTPSVKLTSNITLGSTTISLDPGFLVLERWIHVCFTVTEDYVASIYIDGILQDQDTGTGNMSVRASQLVLGGNGTIPCSAGFNGYMDELRMFRRALSVSEVVTQYRTIDTIDTWSRNVPLWPRSYIPTTFTPSFSNGQFGYAVAMSNDASTVAVGSPNASRAAVYSATTSSFVADLQSVDGTFGSALDISNDGRFVIAGAPTYNNGAGYAAIFYSSNGAVYSNLVGGGSQFGFSVALSGDGTKALVGTPGVNGFNGYANLYAGATVTNLPYVSASADYFGYSVALTGDGTIAVVGAPGASSGTGVVKLYTTVDGLLSGTISSPAGAFGYFGFSVSANQDGSCIAIGAPTANNNFGYAGTFYSNTTSIATLAYSYIGPYPQFGYTVSVSGDGTRVLVGTPFSNSYVNRSGFAGIFLASDGSFFQELTQKSYNSFGESVSFNEDGTQGVVGNAIPDNLPMSIDGSVLVFDTNQRLETSANIYGDYTVAAWYKWGSGKELFSTPVMKLRTFGKTYFVGEHNGVIFGENPTFAWTNQQGASIVSTNISKTAGSARWDAYAYSANSYVYTAFIQANPGQTTDRVAFGLTSNIASAGQLSGYTTNVAVDYAWFLAPAGVLQIFERGVYVGTYETYTGSTILRITYNSQQIKYYKDGQLQRTVNRIAGTPIFGAAALYTPSGSFITGINYGYNFSDILTSTWQHVAASYLGDYSISNIYVNGEQTAYMENVPAYNVISGPFLVGPDWQGYIDDIRTFRGVLPVDQVRAMYTYESTLPPEPTPLSYELPEMALTFGSASVETITDTGSYSVIISGDVTERPTPRLTKTVATPFFLPAVKYLTVAAKTIRPSLRNPGFIVVSTNSSLPAEQTFRIQQVNRNARNLQWQYFNLPQGLIVSSQQDTGIVFKIFKGTTIATNTLVTIQALNPLDSSSSTITFSLSATNGLAIGGDIVTEVGGRRIHIFTSPVSTLSLLAPGSAFNFLLVGGGGGGGAGYAGGGGGAGGFIYRTSETLDRGDYTINVGSAGRGGIVSAIPTAGSDTSFNGFTAIGGGYGASDQTALGGTIVAAGSGGSGGGGGRPTLTAGSGTLGQGFNGGTGASIGMSSGAGGGGAAGAGSSKTIITTNTAPTQYAQFGFSVAISDDGTRYVVGAPYASSGNGYAAVFSSDDGALVSTLTSTAGAGAQFGHCVSISDDGTLVIVGAPTAASGAGYAGVYYASNGIEMATLTGTGNQFGFSVAISGDGLTAAAGTPSTDGTAGYVTCYTGASYATATPVVYTSVADDYFGYAIELSTDGSRIIIGAPNKSSGTGYASIFLTATGTFFRTFVSAAGLYGYFGFSVSISGDGEIAAVGAPTSNTNTGYAATFTVQTGNIRSTLVNVPLGNSQFGYSVSLNNTGSLALVGAPLRTSENADDYGGYAAVFLTSDGALFRPLLSENPLSGISVSLSSVGTSLVGAACPEVFPFRVDGGIAAYS